jgi:hypothetical protein
VSNHAHTVLSNIKAHKLVECTEIKHFQAEGNLIHQYALHAAHPAMNVLDHLIISASAARKANTFL